MNSEATTTAVVSVSTERHAALRNALRLWSDSVTAASTDQRDGLVRYKQKIVEAFFVFVGKHPADVKPADVQDWRNELEKQELSPSTIYSRVCFLSSFFQWAMRDPALREIITSNPVRLALPKAPRAYQTESVKAWTDEELQAIVEVVHRLPHNILTHTEITAMFGDTHLTAVEVKNSRTSEIRKINVAGVFSFIGAVPRTAWLPPEIEKDTKGFIKTGAHVTASAQWTLRRPPFFPETSRAGVFAAGDVRSESVKRVASVVGEGSMAVQFIHEYLKEI